MSHNQPPVQTGNLRITERGRAARPDSGQSQTGLASDISIFVGANNSGKTSASHALQLFMSASRERFSVHDFGAESWAAMDAFGDGVDGGVLPTISLDIWFHVDAPALHRVVDLLPGLAWEGTLVGLRIEFAATDAATLLGNFREARARARANIRPGANGGADYHPSPRTLRDDLADNLRREYELRYYVLDRAKFGPAFEETADYDSLLLTPDKGRGAGGSLKRASASSGLSRNMGVTRQSFSSRPK